jgi:hypothetical protein
VQCLERVPSTQLPLLRHVLQCFERMPYKAEHAAYAVKTIELYIGSLMRVRGGGAAGVCDLLLL